MSNTSSTNTKLVQQIIPEQEFNKVKNIITEIQQLNLRKKIDKERFKEILFDLARNPDLVYYLSVYEEELKNDAKYLKNVGDILLEEGIFSKDFLEHYKLIKKSYTKSGLYIKPREEQYILDGYSLSITDLSTNLENIYAYGLYDGLLQQYIVTPEQLKAYPMENFIREIRYTKRPVSKYLSIWSIKNLYNQTLQAGQIHKYLSTPNLFINTAVDISNKLKTVKKVNNKLELIIKYYVVYNLIKKKKNDIFHGMEINSYYEKLRQEVDKGNLKDLGAILASNIKIADEVIDNQKRPFEFATYFAKLKLGDKDMYISYKELLGKDVILQDLRTKKAREHLVSFIDYVKNNLITGSNSLVFKPERNIFARKIKDKDYIATHNEYNKLVKERIVYEIKLD